MPVKKTMDELESMIPDYRMEFKETKRPLAIFYRLKNYPKNRESPLKGPATALKT
jgi:hypothetical protein